MLNRLRLFMVGRALVGSISSPPAQLSSGRLLRLTRLPSLAPFLAAKQTVGPLQRRIPPLVSCRRPPYVLRAQLEAVADAAMEPPSKRLKAGGTGGQGRKKKPMSPEVEVRLAIQMAARERSIGNAFAAYDRAREADIKINLDSYATLLFLCSGGDEWEATLGGEHPPADATAAAAPEEHIEVTPEVLARGRALFDDMEAAGIVPNEICYTALARMEALGGNPAAALATACSVAAKGLPPRLRCFGPALVGFAEAGDGAAAFKVDAAITEAGLEAGEAELGRLLQAAAGGGVEASAAEDVLKRIARDLTVLQPATIARATAYFESQGWAVGPADVDTDGACPAAGEGARLAAIDLTPEEYDEFRSGIAELAKRHERSPNDFAAFVSWLEAHGPFGAVVDAANVAFYGQNYDSGGFSFAQVGAVVERLAGAHADLRPLVLLHVNRTRAPPAQAPAAQELLNRLRDDKCFYATPQGSNDDWYWMYAAVAAGHRGLLVSNDEMRDHLFHMLQPRFFGKWKQRHQLKYRFSGAPNTLELDYPPPFTTCAQRVERCWVLPKEDGGWVVAKPPRADGSGDAAADAQQ